MKGSAGQVEELPSGKFRVRLSIKGRRRSFGELYDTREQAEAWRAQLAEEIRTGRAKPLEGMTLAAYAEKWLVQRELEKGVREGALRGALKHIEAAPFAAKRLQHVSRGELLAWLRELGALPSPKTGRPLAVATRRLIASTLSGVFLSALDEERIQSSPATRLRLQGRVIVQEPWTYLLPEEQEQLLSVAPLEERMAIQFAMFTGLRSAEQWALEVADVHLGEDPHVVVRYGGPGHHPTKGRKIRKVPLLPKAHAAAVVVKTQLLQNRANPLGLLFPSPGGAMRRRDHPLGLRVVAGKRVDVWKELVAKAFGPEFQFRWHDLRHTCGSSLISGWWGPAMRLEAIRDFLGHAAVRQTERYAHLVPRQAHAKPTSSEVLENKGDSEAHEQ